MIQWTLSWERQALGSRFLLGFTEAFADSGVQPRGSSRHILAVGSQSSVVWLGRSSRVLTFLDPRSAAFATLLSVSAIVAAFLIGLLQRPALHHEGFLPALGLAGLFVVVRFIALRGNGPRWLVAVDALAGVVIVLLTGAPLSEFHFVVLAGLWWAGWMLPRRGAALYAIVFLVPYAVLVVPGAWAQNALAEAAEDLLTVAVLALMIDWFLAVDRRAMELSKAVATARSGDVSNIQLRQRLALAASESPLPIDTLLVGGQLGLTVDQVELLGYLLLGLGNHQIADAVGRSEATVRYRLTRLYRALGVRGRRSAVQRARELGLDSLVDPPPGRP
ncbi:MAG TPA: LuxR C-terminal-related transcriptional regulator [Candidatus Limnocylindria bacterium]